MKIRVRNRERETVLAECGEVADTSEKRRTGLLKHTELKPGEGLWIAPCESVHSFFMKFAIDVVYLDRAKRVKKVRPSMIPWRVSGCLNHEVLGLAVVQILHQEQEIATLLGRSFSHVQEPSLFRLTPFGEPFSDIGGDGDSRPTGLQRQAVGLSLRKLGHDSVYGERELMGLLPHHQIAKAPDTGIGVPESKLASIFKPFTQAEGSTARR